MKKAKVKAVKLSGVKARPANVAHNGETLVVPMSHSFRFFACDCEPPCGLVTFVLEDFDGRPFTVMQLSYDQILGGVVEAALEARDGVDAKMQ
jgi:hypothetical protein